MMCDICDLKCCGCGRVMNVHIGDFSVGRSQVHPYCPDCVPKAWERIGVHGGEWIVFCEQVDFDDADGSCPGAKAGDRVVFLVPLPRGIRLN